jgi:hypothetical protein
LLNVALSRQLTLTAAVNKDDNITTTTTTTTRTVNVRDYIQSSPSTSSPCSAFNRAPSSTPQTFHWA